MAAALLHRSGMSSPLAPDLDARLLADARHLLADLRRPQPWRFWLELALHSAAGWAAIGLAVFADLGTAGVAASVVVASFAMLRALVFLHELVHLPPRALPGLRAAWAALWGIPFLLPAWLYARVHLEHHHRRVYGTALDPEYVPIARTGPRAFTLGAFLGALVPAALLLRFLVLPPLGWTSASFRRTLDARFSALAANPAWRAPPPGPALGRTMRVDEVLCFAWGWGLVALAAGGALPARAPWVLLGVMVGAASLNQLRALAAHRFVHSGEPGGDLEMLRDTVNVEVSPLERLVFPLGIQLHALHHLAPSIPFHHLEEAHRRLTARLPPESVYRRASEPGLATALRRLVARVAATASAGAAARAVR
jgi:fatty acid desaturase